MVPQTSLVYRTLLFSRNNYWKFPDRWSIALMTIFGATGIEVFHFSHQRSCERKKKNREREIEERGGERLRLSREGERE